MSDQIDTTETTFPPPGFLDRAGACAMFDVSSETWLRWQRTGRVTCGQFHQRPADGHCVKLYPVDELRRLRDQIDTLDKPYPDPRHPGAWRVPLNGYSARREVLIDEADLPIVQGRSRCWRERSDGSGGLVIVTIDARQKPLHRLILGLTDKAARVSFANGDPLDCRRRNLVVRTQAQVAYAARPPKMRDGKARTSTFKGVGFDRKSGNWRASITRAGLQTAIGSFDDERAAAEAFDDCARVWYGEHAYLNFPERPLTEAKRAWAQGVLDKAARRLRRRRRRLKKLKRLLKHEARDANADAGATREDVPTIRSHKARKLLGVPTATWLRWQKRGWLTFGRLVDGRKVYPMARIKRLLEACGRLRPPYPDPQRPDVWRVPLVGRAAGRAEALIDAPSLPLIECGWCTMCGARKSTGDGAYVSLWAPAAKQNRPLRRIIAGVTDDLLDVGHRNGDPLDCRRENLVVLTVAQRSYRNRKIKSINGKLTTSQFKGVSWHKKGAKWMAMIHCGGTARYLGLHDCEDDAALAYDRAARELFGEHARLNFPDGADACPEVQAPATPDGPAVSDHAAPRAAA
jgi:hypothetical protein